MLLLYTRNARLSLFPEYLVKAKQLHASRPVETERRFILDIAFDTCQKYLESIYNKLNYKNADLYKPKKTFE